LLPLDVPLKYLVVVAILHPALELAVPVVSPVRVTDLLAENSVAVPALPVIPIPQVPVAPVPSSAGAQVLKLLESKTFLQACQVPLFFPLKAICPVL